MGKNKKALTILLSVLLLILFVVPYLVPVPKFAGSPPG